MNILDLVVGKPIKTSDERAEQIGPAQGIPIFGLDALSSAAYGQDAALSLLIPLGFLGSYLSFCLLTSHNDRRGRSPCSLQRRASHTGSSASDTDPHDGSGQLLATAEGFRQWLHGFDWRRGCQQWREGFSRAHGEKR